MTESRKLKLIFFLLFIFVLGNHGYERSKNVPVFVQSVEDLHREPPFPPSKTRAVETEWIVQKLDQFNETETQEWQMRYFVNREHYIEGGPIFIYVGGEWTISSGSIAGGHFYDLAKEHNGILYYTEHRFYGQSKPTTDISVQNLQYLHIKQALADLAYFIQDRRANEPGLANSKVIMGGCSYAATMVTWFKYLYPELLAGGWASSAPLLAKVDFEEYKEVVGRALYELGSEKCYNRVSNGFAELEALFENGRSAEAKAMLQLCNNFDENNDLDLWSLFGTLSNLFSSIVQYQGQGDVPFYCDYLLQFDNDAEAIAKFFLRQYGGYGCLDVTYSSTVEYYEDISYTWGASRPWKFQTCNEYGWYQSSASASQPFGTKFPALLYTTLCNDVFNYANSTVFANAAQTNLEFGGINPNIENIYSTHGGLDPWSPMGYGEADGATIIPQHSHCTDLGSISSTDSAELRASKERLAELVREWLETNKK